MAIETSADRAKRAVSKFQFVREDKDKISPRQILIYGDSGIGKTTFGADAEGIAILALDRGSSHLPNCQIKDVETLEDVQAILDEFPSSGFKGILIDTLDKIDEFIYTYLDAKIAQEGAGKVKSPKSLKEMHDSTFGEGHRRIAVEWRRILSKLDKIILSGKEVCLIAHSKSTKETNLEGEDFSQWDMQIAGKKGPAMIRAWASYILFAHQEFFTLKDKLKVTAKTGQRFLYLSSTGAFSAKCRGEILWPTKIPLRFSGTRALFDALAITISRFGKDLDPVLQERLRTSKFEQETETQFWTYVASLPYLSIKKSFWTDLEALFIKKLDIPSRSDEDKDKGREFFKAAIAAKETPEGFNSIIEALATISAI